MVLVYVLGHNTPSYTRIGSSKEKLCKKSLIMIYYAIKTNFVLYQGSNVFVELNVVINSCLLRVNQ